MPDVFEIADILVDDIRKRFADCVAIVAYYGSYANGTATPRSDLDFFFIPDGPGASGASLQFIIDGIGFDFWPISWARAERIASFDEAIVSVIADCRILYSRSPVDLERFEALRERIRSMSLPENRALMVRKARNAFKDCYPQLFRIMEADRQVDLSKVRRHAARLASVAASSLALLNQTYFRKGMGQNMTEIMALDLKPDGLDSLLGVVSSSTVCAEIRAACETLVDKTDVLISGEEAALRKMASFSDAFEGFHEEALSTYNKIVTACDRGDRETAFYASLHLQEELEGALESAFGKNAYRDLGLTDLAAVFDADDLASLRNVVTGLEARVRGILEAHGVTLKEFDSPEALREYLTFALPSA